MTNAFIIMNHALALLEQGKIQGTGNFITVTDADGNEKALEMPESIHTFAEWKRCGFIVKRGEHAIDTFPIWKPITRRVETEDPDADGETTTKMIMVKAAFFAAHQVQPLK